MSIWWFNCIVCLIRMTAQLAIKSTASSQLILFYPVQFIVLSNDIWRYWGPCNCLRVIASDEMVISSIAVALKWNVSTMDVTSWSIAGLYMKFQCIRCYEILNRHFVGALQYIILQMMCRKFIPWRRTLNEWTFRCCKWIDCWILKVYTVLIVTEHSQGNL